MTPGQCAILKVEGGYQIIIMQLDGSFAVMTECRFSVERGRWNPQAVFYRTKREARDALRMMNI
jgi:hypothetical protein